MSDTMTEQAEAKIAASIERLICVCDIRFPNVDLAKVEFERFALAIRMAAIADCRASLAKVG